MIRIQHLLYKISLSVVFGLITSSLFAQLTMGAKGLGMGQATTAIPGYEWALFANPALLNSDNAAIGFYGLRNYGFAELTDMSATGSVPTKLGVAALGFHRYGDNLFSETRIRFGYKNDWQMLHFGVVANYNHISFGADYGSGGALGLDVGIAAELAEDLWIGARSTNVNHPEYGDIDEELAREMAIGFTYGLNELAVFAFDVVKDVRFPVSYRGGLEIAVIEDLKGRVGITTEPLSYSLGFGYGKDRWSFNFAVQKHELLGFSPGIDFMLYF
ncbi:MAG: hypothetical protein HUJ22_00880 [Gracilimonas sp.]|uniref:hypothetical protein n=1 Tax=Gracilimonas sp. TaxID=1974203 RepID=UPI0019B428C9|nr:hypothetical protein [Gracilimonas sp.]MBD3615095.1 hypothetical protein [Gracilimonas sp.]